MIILTPEQVSLLSDEQLDGLYFSGGWGDLEPEEVTQLGVLLMNEMIRRSNPDLSDEAWVFWVWVGSGLLLFATAFMLAFMMNGFVW